MELSQTVRRGGNRPKLPQGTLLRSHGLPEGVSRKQSMVYQQLAAVPEPVFRGYLDACRANRVVPSSTGARKHGRHASRRGQARPGKHVLTGLLELPSSVLEAVGKIMTPDVLVGSAKIRSPQHVAPDAQDVFERLAGRVFVASCPDPSRWVPKLQELRASGRIARVVFAAPAEVWERWFDQMVRGGWAICFLQDHRAGAVGRLVAHLGEKPAAFRLAMNAVGPVVG